MRGAQGRWSAKNKDTLRNELLQPLFKQLGFNATAHRVLVESQEVVGVHLTRGNRVRHYPRRAVAFAARPRFAQGQWEVLRNVAMWNRLLTAQLFLTDAQAADE